MVFVNVGEDDVLQFGGVGADSHIVVSGNCEGNEVARIAHKGVVAVGVAEEVVDAVAVIFHFKGVSIDAARHEVCHIVIVVVLGNTEAFGKLHIEFACNQRGFVVELD